MTRGITKVTFTRSIDCPAAIWTHSGELLLHPELWGQLPEDQRLFVILHELGHRVLQTSDELAADKWASDQFFHNYQGSPQQSVFALTDGLNFSNPEHTARAMAQLERARIHDQKMNSMEASNYGMAGTLEQFLGLGKAAKARREEKQSQKAEQRQLKNDRKAARVEVIASRADRNRAKAGQIAARDPNAPSQASELLSQGLGVVGSIFGKGGGDDERISGNVDFNAGGEPEPAKDKTMTYVLIGVAVLVVVVVVVMVLKKGKGK